jgi:hypothetical protein
MKRQSRTNNSDKFVHPQTSKTQDAGGLFDELTQINVENLGYELGKKFRRGIAKEIANIGTRRKQGAAIAELQTKRAVESVKEKLQRQQKQQKEQQEQQQHQQQDDDDANGDEASTNEIDQTTLDEFVSVDLSISSQQPPPKPKPKGPHAQQTPNATNTNNKTATRDGSSNHNNNYTLGAHAKYLHLGAEGNGRYHYCDVSHLFLDDLKDNDDDDDDDNYDDGYLKEHTPPPNLIKDYISPISFPELQKLYFGLEPSSQGSGSSEPLPVRTLAIRIRPDVKSRIVIDTVQRAFDDLDPSRCIILQNHECHFRYAMRQSLAPFVIDSQLCTSRIMVENNDNNQQDSAAGLERYLVLRVFPIMDYTQVLIVEDGDNPYNPVGTDAASDSQSKDPIPDEPFRLNLQLKEASSLLQFLHKYSNNSGMDDNVKVHHPQSCRMPSLRKSQKGTTTYFLERSSYKESMAVRKISNKKSAFKATGGSATRPTTQTTRGDMILPALSKEDWATLQSSSTVLQKIWDR